MNGVACTNRFFLRGYYLISTVGTPKQTLSTPPSLSHVVRNDGQSRELATSTPVKQQLFDLGKFSMSSLLEAWSGAQKS
jgi:hypothetical protein